MWAASIVLAAFFALLPATKVSLAGVGGIDQQETSDASGPWMPEGSFPRAIDPFKGTQPTADLGPTEVALLGQLGRHAKVPLRISYHATTGKVRFIGADVQQPIPQMPGLATSATCVEGARAFLSAYGALFGLSDQSRELVVMRERTADGGRAFVRFQQVYEGIPVLGGELIVQMDSHLRVISAHGEVLPDVNVDMGSSIGAEAAREKAMRLVAKHYGLFETTLTATKPELWVYSPILLGAPGPCLVTLVWRMDVTSSDLLPVRELVLVDATRGNLVLHFDQIGAAKSRQVYDNGNDAQAGLPGNGPVRGEGWGPTGIPSVDDAYSYLGDTYDFYYSVHGRDSIDDAGMPLICTARYCEPWGACPYPNAYWTGSQVVFGQGFSVADDVVAHELTHGVTRHESNLFYFVQSGAINEALSDIWGEFVDLSNGKGNDDASVRWLIGEDLPDGAVRSLSNPPDLGCPDKMSSALFQCGLEDNGGVHTNCGVGSKAAYLMTDGGTFNGITVTGLGITKVAQIFYEVQTNLLTSGADYQDLYDALIQASVNLIGTSGISRADVQQVRNAVDATEMNLRPADCTAVESPLCDGGLAKTLFFDDMEDSALGNWVAVPIVGGSEWYYVSNYAASGDSSLWGSNQATVSDSYAFMDSAVRLPSNALLHFGHAFDFESWGSDLYDGGVIEYRIDGSATWHDAGPLIVENGYNGTIDDCCDNPLAGRSAFTGASYGYISTYLDLATLAGQNVRFRFRIGTDWRVSHS